MASPEDICDVGIFHHEDDSKNVEIIKQALIRKGLRVRSYDDFVVGEDKFQSRVLLIKTCWCVVLYVTEKFVDDAMSQTETALAVDNRIETRLPKVVPVKAYSDLHNLHSSFLKSLLNIYVPIQASWKPDKIATKIQETVSRNKEKAGPIPLEVSKFQIKGLEILRMAVLKIIDYHGTEEKLKRLYCEMKPKIDPEMRKQKPTGQAESATNNECCCIEGELWKKNIDDQQYWTVTTPAPYKNGTFKKCKREGYHFTDLHGLFDFEPKGYFKLAAVFLTKPVKPFTQNCTKISEYFDADGILQLLKRCKAVTVEPEATDKLKDARNELFHLPLDVSETEGQELIDRTAKTIKEALRVLIPDCFDNLCRLIDEIRSGKLNVSIERKLEMDREVESLREDMERVSLENFNASNKNDGAS